MIDSIDKMGWLVADFEILTRKSMEDKVMYVSKILQYLFLNVQK